MPHPSPYPGNRPSIAGWRRLLLETTLWTDQEVGRLIRCIDDPVRFRAFCATGRPPARAVPETTHPVALGGLLLDAITLRQEVFGVGTVVSQASARTFLVAASIMALRAGPRTPRQLRDLAPMLAMVAPEAFTLETDCSSAVLDAINAGCSFGWARHGEPTALLTARYELMPPGRMQVERLLHGAWRRAIVRGADAPSGP